MLRLVEDSYASGKPRVTQEYQDLELWVELGIPWHEFQNTDVTVIQKLKEYREAVSKGQDRKVKINKLKSKTR